jgi:hypothetical protein
MTSQNDAKLLLRYFIRDTFGSSPELKEMCNSKKRVCRGGSIELYTLILRSKGIRDWLDPDNVEIVSGMGHTFLRYKDNTYSRFIYMDPTIGQFIPSFDGIFIGDEKDLKDLAASPPPNTLDLKDYLGPLATTNGKWPPLKIETNQMKYIKEKIGGGRRKSTERRKRTRRRKRT